MPLLRPAQDLARGPTPARFPSGSAPFRQRIAATALAASLTLLASVAAAGDLPPPVFPGGSDGTHDATAEAAWVRPGTWPRGTWPLPRDAALERRVQTLLAKMTVEEKVGQTVQADINSITPEDMRRYHLGSILAGGNSGPGGRPYAGPAAWLALADDFHRASTDRSDGGQGIPALFGIDAVHGHNNVVGATLFPHNIGLGAARDPALVRRIAAATAEELRATGFDWTFAPTLAVPQDARWGRTYEGFSSDPSLVAAYAGPIVEGFQGRAGSRDFLGPSRVLATAKHFVGDGGTADGRDQGDARIPEDELRSVHGAGYPPAIGAGVQAVMASFSSWNGTKLLANRGLLEDVLRGRLRFDGFVVGDWNAHGQVAGCSNEDCPTAVLSGMDMAMAPDSWRGYYDHTLRDVREGRLPMARLDEAVARILRVKLRAGLFEAGLPSSRPFATRAAEVVGAPAHRALARQAVRESLVLLKNRGHLLPLSPRSRLLVAGDGADDLPRQSGGWTLTWQGTGTTRADFPGATSIWDGLRSQVEAAGGHAVLSAEGHWDAAGGRPDAAIVVFGESPYAEFQGDLATLAYRPGDDADLALLRRLKADGIPVVAVFLSGRPLWVNREINAADAFVAAWLPGSEGAGVADVLLRRADGGIAHDFHGRLPYAWPATAVPAPGAAPQFALGHGLRYGDDGDLPPLPEVSGVAGGVVPSGLYFARGTAVPGTGAALVGADGVSTPVATAPAASADGAIALQAIDHRAQEDARLLQWRGGGGAFELNSIAPLDLRRETNGDVLMVLTVQVRQAPTAPVWLETGCGGTCRGRVRIDGALAALPADGWRRLGVPLKCLQAAGADMGRVVRTLRIDAEGPLALGLSRVELATDPDATVACTTP